MASKGGKTVNGLVDKAVIDVGSNSVRLVVFRTHETFFQPIFNEKVLAGLGRGVAQTGKLNPEGAVAAMAALKRYKRIIKARGVSNVLAVATAAVRVAEDGPDFIKAVKAQTGLRISIIAGLEEARLSALGVIAGAPDAVGVIGDLGGSSLELVPVGKGRVKRGISLPLGPLAMRAGGDMDIKAMSARIDEALDEASAQITTKDSGSFYAVGGAWRSLALVNMALRGHPLRVLHNYRISRDEAFELVHLVGSQSPASLARTPGLSSRRAPLLPYAALLLERILQRQFFESVTISGYGLREGLLYEELGSKARAKHPVLAGVKALAQQNWSSSRFGSEVQRWLEPVRDVLKSPFGEPRTNLMMAAACRLADIGARLHPDHRAQIAFDIVLFAPFAGLSHEERVALALCIFYRYSGDTTPPRGGLIGHLLGKEQKDWALGLGMSLRCAAAVSGRTSKLLKRTHVHLQDDQLYLVARDDAQELLTARAQKRLQEMAAALGLETGPPPNLDVAQ
ncbi:MAG: Ppx/GppA phosphatase family protein [Robiginitomaculum sp.]|nr:Ppx/GppA phosphatase family protein [Robiginitomaculum sp.]